MTIHSADHEVNLSVIPGDCWQSSVRTLPFLENDIFRLTPQAFAGRRIKWCEGSCEVTLRAGAQMQAEAGFLLWGPVREIAALYKSSAEQQHSAPA